MSKWYMMFDLNPRNMNMSYKKYHSPHLSLAQNYWKGHLEAGDIAIDATAGNGHDTLFLSQLLLNHPEGTVFAYDIQREALDTTKNLLLTKLSSDQIDRVYLCHKSHASIHETPFQKAPRLIVFNLGYLPGGDKTITTQTETSLESIKSSLKLLAPDGALSIMCYPGHEEGSREEQAITAFVSSLPSKNWLVCHHRYLNRLHSPTLIWIRARPP